MSIYVERELEPLTGESTVFDLLYPCFIFQRVRPLLQAGGLRKLP